jgi:hypothetical protein
MASHYELLSDSSAVGIVKPRTKGGFAGPDASRRQFLSGAGTGMVLAGLDGAAAARGMT